MKWIGANWFKVALLLLAVWLIFTLQNFKVTACVTEPKEIGVMSLEEC